MMATLRAEFRKLLSVRSTYIVTAIAIVLTIFAAGYIEGWRLSPSDLHSPYQFSSDVLGALSIMIFGAIIAILLMTHEYRYNTIMYTLTSSNNRSKVLLAKVITVSVYAVLLTAFLCVLSPVATDIGVHLHGHHLVPQTVHFWNLAWRSLYYGWVYSLVGLVLAVIIRVQVGAIAALFLIPGLVEQLLSQLLKSNAVYLPFTALGQVISTGTDENVGGGHLTPSKAAAVFAIYFVIAWIIAWVLFLRRDAN